MLVDTTAGVCPKPVMQSAQTPVGELGEVISDFFAGPGVDGLLPLYPPLPESFSLF